MKRPCSLMTVLFVLLTPALLLAHPDHAGAHRMANGFIHPFTGLDHILALTAIGLWAAQLGGSGKWKVPLAFLVMMIAGGLLAAAHVALPMVESGILASVLILGLVLLFALRLPAWAAMALAGLFAVFHGYAHVADLHVSSTILPYAAGFVLASAILLFTGVAAGSLMQRLGRHRMLRAAGAVVAAGGVLLLAMA